jgi:tetratricopeptide (TPR) repeat protein
MPTTHTHRKRISRKDLKKHDEFQTFFEDARGFLSENLKQVLLGAGVALFAAAVAFGTYAYEHYRDRVAADRFYVALDALNGKHYAKAEAAFAKLAAEEPGRTLGGLAQFYLGTCYADQGKLPKARDTLNAYLKEDREPMFSNLALAYLGGVYERMGDFKQAEAAYARAADVPGPEQASAQLAVARMMTRRGDKAGAIKAYRRFLETHPFYQGSEAVLETLASLGAGPSPARVEPAPPPVGAKPAPAPAR